MKRFASALLVIGCHQRTQLDARADAATEATSPKSIALPSSSAVQAPTRTVVIAPETAPVTTADMQAFDALISTSVSSQRCAHSGRVDARMGRVEDLGCIDRLWEKEVLRSEAALSPADRARVRKDDWQRFVEKACWLSNELAVVDPVSGARGTLDGQITIGCASGYKEERVAYLRALANGRATEFAEHMRLASTRIRPDAVNSSLDDDVQAAGTSLPKTEQGVAAVTGMNAATTEVQRRADALGSVMCSGWPALSAAVMGSQCPTLVVRYLLRRRT